MMEQSDDKAAFDIESFCRRHSIGRIKVYQEITKGRLRAIKVGRRTLITAADAYAWLSSLPAFNPKNRAV